MHPSETLWVLVCALCAPGDADRLDLCHIADLCVPEGLLERPCARERVRRAGRGRCEEGLGRLRVHRRAIHPTGLRRNGDHGLEEQRWLVRHLERTDVHEGDFQQRRTSCIHWEAAAGRLLTIDWLAYRTLTRWTSSSPHGRCSCTPARRSGSSCCFLYLSTRCRASTRTSGALTI